MPKTVTEEYLSSLKLVELRAVAAELGVEVRGLRSKAEVKARLIEKKEGAPLEDSDDESTGEDSEDGVGQAPETGASNPGAGAHLARGTEASEGLRAPPPLHPEPQWHTRPPFSEGELADPTEWLRDPWRAFEEAKRVWGPSTLRAASAKREVTRAFEVIRQLVPRIQDPAIQDTVAGLIRDAITRRWNPRALAAAEQRQKWADFPSEIVELREEYDKEVKKTKPRFRSRGPESRVRQGGKGYRGSSAHRDAPFRGDSRKGGKKGGWPSGKGNRW
ncbi:hypothetical protein DIPPA_34982 [Diplonema papillatum]|nr:hypothetical protein DIPPA_34340 [Diplonema papillatum]KAJ9442108.1 hypothetical protein DIPPA_21875 [Diplonema papillatum]KAJ9451170.1 hypothetical protein DIPPA_19781 [Diplonema papillatum]KAJ9456111.1 hypothetical protein DIPPA_18284 [Diplonema papillatum]KAJ9461518.1 hypothetical protein DIPPA_28490 [Diplonema papillatum]